MREIRQKNILPPIHILDANIVVSRHILVINTSILAQVIWIGGSTFFIKGNVRQFKWTTLMLNPIYNAAAKNRQCHDIAHNICTAITFLISVARLCKKPKCDFSSSRKTLLSVSTAYHVYSFSLLVWSSTAFSTFRLHSQVSCLPGQT
jgi:hypothetical protein